MASVSQAASFCPFRKALDALAFSSRAGFGIFAVPTKLIGVKAHQAAIRALRTSGAQFGFRLRLMEQNGRLAVLWGDERVLGFIQPKHAHWLRPLAGLGIEVRLIGVTGNVAAGHTLGVNIALCSPGQGMPQLEPGSTDVP